MHIYSTINILPVEIFDISLYIIGFDADVKKTAAWIRHVVFLSMIMIYFLAA